jgi:3-hydroxybutyrate dehydrogenase
VPRYARTPLVEDQLADQAAVHGVSTGEVLSDVLLVRSAVKRLIEPGEVAGAVAYLCSPEATSVGGNELVLDGGWSAS